VYFVTQNPADVPEDKMGQLGNRVQHALRAYTAMDQRALRLAAETYRDNARFNTQDAILQVGVVEAVTSFLQKKGVPGVVERTLIRPPSSQLGPITPSERQSVVNASPLFGKYETPIDRCSAYEILSERAKAAAA
jgi:DNA helicase HerA-like ATPase